MEIINNNPNAEEIKKAEFSASEWETLTKHIEEGLPLKDSLILLRFQSQGVSDSEGNLKDDWKHAIFTILKSSVEIFIYAGATQTAWITNYYTDSKSQNLYSAVISEEQKMTVSFPFSYKTVLNQLSPLIEHRSHTEDMQYVLELRLEDFYILIAYIDTVKSQYIQSMLNREPFEIRPSTDQEINDCYLKGKESTDLRWLFPAIRNISPGEFEFDQETVKISLTNLTNQNFLEKRDDGYFLTKKTSIFITSLIEHFAVTAIRISKREENNFISVDFISTLKTSDLLWILSFSGPYDRDLKITILNSVSEKFTGYLEKLFEKYSSKMY